MSMSAKRESLHVRSLLMHYSLVLKPLLSNLGCSIWLYLYFLKDLILVIKYN